MCDIVLASELIEGEQHNNYRERHVQAMKWAVEQGEKRAPFTLYTVLKISSLMFPYGGEMRHKPEHNVVLLNISGDMPVKHQPLPGSEVPQAMRMWCEEVKHYLSTPRQTDDERLQDIVQQHIDFEQIHPLPDGNGRVGRAILNYMAAYLGLPLISIRCKRQYIQALNNTDISLLIQSFNYCDNN